MINKKKMRFIFLPLAFVFFLQALGVVSLVPIGPIISFLGISDSPLQLFISMFYAVMSVFILSAFAEILYSFGFKRETSFLNRKRVYAGGVIAFLTIWVTFFSYGILAMFQIIPNEVIPEIVFNLYVCWYLLLQFFIRFPVEKRRKTISQSEDAFPSDVCRVTWWSHITRLNTADEFKGEKGEVVFSQGNALSILFAIIFLFVGLTTFPFLRIFGAVLFGAMPIHPSELASPMKIIIAFFFFSILTFLITLLGMVFSRRGVVYKNCISLPLPTFSDKPMFTAFLPQSLAVLPFSEVKSYKIEKAKYKNSANYYISTISFWMNNGDYFLWDPSVPLELEATLVALIGVEKRTK